MNILSVLLVNDLNLRRLAVNYYFDCRRQPARRVKPRDWFVFDPTEGYICVAYLQGHCERPDAIAFDLLHLRFLSFKHLLLRAVVAAFVTSTVVPYPRRSSWRKSRRSFTYWIQSVLWPRISLFLIRTWMLSMATVATFVVSVQHERSRDVDMILSVMLP